MAHAYTPGLKVTESTVIQKKRLLPILGTVTVKVGDRVSPTTVVAKTDLPGKVHIVNVVNAMTISPAEIRQYMVKKENDVIKKGEVIAQNKPLIKWFKKTVNSPIEGTIENISDVTGQVLLRELPQPLEVYGYISSSIREIFPTQGVLVQTYATLVQGIFGVGGETHGKIEIVVKNPDEELSPQMITAAHKDKIIIGGSHASMEALNRAKEMGVRGVVVGGIHDKDLRQLLGYDLGVAITGTEKIGFTLITTEGFGKIAMAKKTFELLQSKAGREASISGATQIRAGVIRPEIIISHDQTREGKILAGKEQKGLTTGDMIRIIREPFFGRVAMVKELPPEPEVIQTGSKVRILTVQLSDGTTATIPRANVEIIEE